MTELSPSLLLNAYAHGIFPMADENDEILWFSPDPRAVIELDCFHIPGTLRQLYRQGRFAVTVDRCFESVIERCADRSEGTWIAEIRDAYVRLHHAGHAHSVEVWSGEELAGGLYGVSLGERMFFGESMFHRVNNASKIGLVHLVHRLSERDFTLLDTQFKTEHLEQFNCLEIPRNQYLQRLDEALKRDCQFD